MNVLQTHTHLSIPTIHCILKELEQPIPQFVHYKKPNNNIHNPEFEFHLWQTTHQIFLCHWFLSNLSDHLCLHVFPCFWVPSLPCFLCSCLFFSTFLFPFFSFMFSIIYCVYVILFVFVHSLPHFFYLLPVTHFSVCTQWF